jgi:transcriptional regulator of arginine metabolism
MNIYASYSIIIRCMQTSKLTRHGVILELVKHGPLPSQDELRRTLAKHGFKVTQATLSRDIHRLGLVKMAQGYTLPQAVNGSGATEAALPALQRLIREFVREVREAQNLLVVKTATGAAQPVCAAWDAEAWPDIVGTVAGDDTILIITPDRRTARRVANRIRGMVV